PEPGALIVGPNVFPDEVDHRQRGARTAARLAWPLAGDPRSVAIYRSRPVRGLVKPCARSKRRRRGSLPPRPPSHRRQPHHEARPEHAWRLASGGDTVAVFDPNCPAMRLDDLLTDRQAKAGILPEALMRPISVEALEDLVQRFGTNARAVVVDHDLHLVFQPAACHAHSAAGRRERAGIVDQIADHLAEPRVVSRHFEKCRVAAFEGKPDV